MNTKIFNLQRYLIVIISFLLFSLGCEKDTSGPPPTISTSQVTNIKDIAADCGGKITDKGNSKIVALGICWSQKKQEPTVSDDYCAVGTYTLDGIVEKEWNFSAQITGLKATTQYHVRAYAANESGVAYGKTVTFTTKAGKIFHKLTPDMLITYTQEVSEGAKKNLVDGDFGTYWHSAWSENVAPLPHYIQINFSKETSIGGFSYWHRKPSGKAGRPTQFDLQTSTDGNTWTTVWTSEPDLPIDFDDTTFEKGNTILFGKNFKSKHFRLRILTNKGNTSFTYLSELKVFEDGTV